MRRSLQHGFTLLELMVVVVLIGIILTFVVRSVGDGGRSDHIKQEAQRIASLVELVGEEAVLQSAVIGMHLSDEGYEFMRYDGESWQPITDDSLLKRRPLDGAMEMRLQVEGFAVEVGGGSADEDEEKRVPQLIFLPSGERTPFELALRYEDDDSGFLLSAAPLGAVAQRRLEGRRW